MKNYKNVVFVLASAAVLSLATVGCDRTVQRSEETNVKSDGTVKTKDTTVTEHPDGTVTKTEEKKKTTPNP